MDENKPAKFNKGIGSLIKSTKRLNEKQENKKQSDSGVASIDISLIEQNSHQPRKYFSQEKLETLKNSIIENGLLQPITVIEKNEGTSYQLIAGERRLRACKLAGMTEIPAIIKNSNQENKSILALIENTQREDLNAVEIANAYAKLIDDFGLTQEEAAKKTGEKRGTVSNYMRILKLPEMGLKFLKEEKISFGHAKVLAGLEDEDLMLDLIYQTVEKNLSVKALTALIKKSQEEEEEQINDLVQAEEDFDSGIMSTAQLAEQNLIKKYKFNFNLKENSKGGGSFTIKFKSKEELEKILDELL